MSMKKHLLTLVAVVALIFAFGSVSAAATSDEQIESSAKQSFVFRSLFTGTDITVKSKDGVVTLTGKVPTQAHRDVANETVANIPGVKDINNKLTSDEATPNTYSDSWIKAKVMLTLFFHRNVGIMDTDVTAKNGIVTLRGNVDSLVQKDLTTEYARDVEGVLSVNNEMTVSAMGKKPAAATTPEKPATTEKPTTLEKPVVPKESVDDASITALVKTTLLYHRSTSALKPTVATQAGVVTLTGSAKTSTQKDLVAKLVSDVHGVNKVVNEMTVE